MLTLKINGKSHKVDADPDMPLLWVLRDLLGMNGTKFGCGVALCGACTVHLDGIPRRSCVMPVSAAVGHAITTIEGIGATPVGKSVQQAWLDLEVVQCGYCQSGQIVHQPLVVRGKDGHGAPTQRCQTCHQATNTADGFVPGVATWALAPLSMLWEGKTKAQICEQMKDPERNGGRRAGEDVIEHMKSDPLVLWAWNPDAGRTTPPLTHAQLVEALEAWVGAGMPCPTD